MDRDKVERLYQALYQRCCPIAFLPIQALSGQNFRHELWLTVFQGECAKPKHCVGNLRFENDGHHGHSQHISAYHTGPHCSRWLFHLDQCNRMGLVLQLLFRSGDDSMLELEYILRGQPCIASLRTESEAGRWVLEEKTSTQTFHEGVRTDLARLWAAPGFLYIDFKMWVVGQELWLLNC